MQTKAVIENITPTEIQKQGFSLAPPPKGKPPEDCSRSYIDQLPDGYSSAKLVRNSPQTNKDIYFKFRPRKARPTEMRSIRRHYSHRSVALYRTKKHGPTRANIEYMTCSFLELDGSTDNTIKTQRDVLALIEKNNLSTASYIIGTSTGNFHVLWIYSRPLEWTSKGESYWTAQQKRLIELFKRAGFNVDRGASLNPTQNLRNPSQLKPYNFKRRCEVEIHKTYSKTSLRLIYRALNKTSIANPRPIRASVKLRRYLRANQTFTLTLAELAESIGTSLSTAERVVKKAIGNGDLFAVGKVGNNRGITRATEYRSGLYLEPQFSEPSLSISKNNSVKEPSFLTHFRSVGAKKGFRNKTIFALGLYLKAQLGKRACIEAIRDTLKGGAMRCHVPIKEFERTLQNVMKPIYDRPLSRAKMRAWELLEPEQTRESFLH